MGETLVRRSLHALSKLDRSSRSKCVLNIYHSESGTGLKVGVIPLSAVSPLVCAMRIWSDTACVAQLEC